MDSFFDHNLHTNGLVEGTSNGERLPGQADNQISKGMTVPLVARNSLALVYLINVPMWYPTEGYPRSL